MEQGGAFGVQLLVQATAAAGLAKTGVDVIRAQGNVYGWVPPVAAWVLSLIILICLFEASGQHVDERQTLFTVTLGAFIAAPLAMGATALQSHVERKATDQKVADVQDAAQANTDRLMMNLSSALEEAAQRGAERAIDIARATPAA